jgi:predicted RecB family nuclease
VYAPVLFTPHERVTRDDRLRLAFGGAILARIQGAQPDSGRIIHGRQFKMSRVGLGALSGPVRDAVDQIRLLGESAAPPPLLLNRHSAELEFRRSCRAAAVEKDDLSLLRGLSPKDIAGLNRRRPELPGGVTRLHLDVEGLPDEDCYYLIGLTVEEGDCRRHFSYWADNPAEEVSIWRAFLEIVGRVGDFCLFHDGSYETHFVEKMGARHGGDPDLLARSRPAA